jgi:RNA polymerase-binding transcription factor DksA
MNSARSEAFRRTLIERRSQLLSQVTELESDLDWLQANVEPELLEEGQEQALAGVLESLDEHDRAELTAIDKALERIRQGRYGACESCGEAIPLARQLAVPTTALCRPCAEGREQEA